MEEAGSVDGDTAVRSPIEVVIEGGNVRARDDRRPQQTPASGQSTESTFTFAPNGGLRKQSADLRDSVGDLIGVTALKTRAARLFGLDTDSPLSPAEPTPHEERMAQLSAIRRPTGWFSIADLQAQVLTVSEVERFMTLYDVTSSTARQAAGLSMLDAASWQVQLSAVMEREDEDFQLRVGPTNNSYILAQMSFT